jgi:hypothetical protein
MFSTLLIGDGSKTVNQDLFDCILTDGRGVVPYLSDELSPGLVIPFDVLRQFTYVHLIPGDLFPTIAQATQHSLAQYVSDGGTLVCTPFTAWSAYFRGNDLLRELLPVECKGFYEGQQIRLQDEPITLHQGLSTDRYSGHTFVGTDEDLRLLKGSECICWSSHHSKPNPFLARRQYGHGYVLYVNAVHHCDEGELEIWRSAGNLTPAYDLMRSWSFQCVLDSARAKRGNMVRFVTELAQLFLQPEGCLAGQDAAVLASPREESARFLESMAVHYGYGYPIQGLLFPSTREYSSMTTSERNVICRAIVSTASLWSSPDDIRLEDPSQREAVHITNDLKKQYLEKLSAFFFLLVDGLSLTARNVRTKTSELDIVLRNESPNRFWANLGSLIAVECKNWSQVVGAKEIRDFHGKMMDLGIKTGFFISPLGFSGNAKRDAQLVIRDCRKDGFLIVPITLSEMRQALRFLDPTPIVMRAYEAVFLL